MEIRGKSVYKGIAIGPIVIRKKRETSVDHNRITDPEEEIRRFEEAKEKARIKLHKLYEKALEEAGKEGALVFDAHQMMLDDPEYIESVQNIIRTRSMNAEYAVAKTGEIFSDMFARMDDEYMRERATDVKDVSERLINILSGKDSRSLPLDTPYILLADDLTPSETVQLDKTRVLSFVTRRGSTNSHVAILAGSMNIPALVGVDFSDDMDGKTAIVDGINGLFIVDPDADTIQEYEARRKKEAEKIRLLQELKGKENVTLDGKRIEVYANIGGVGDMEEVEKNDAGGIGLFRSEFLFLGRNNLPDEEEQLKAYRAVAERMAGKPVVIRTLDIGADKQADYLDLDHEENPALGYRAIRICLDRRDIFETQLKAIYRASCYGNIRIMFPMIISVDEIREIRSIIADVKKSLDDQGIAYKEIPIGVMIETPAAVMISRELAEEVDFFSIGTNDLTQYMLAIDRQNPKLDRINDMHHPAILRAIEMTVKNGHEGGVRVGICGELAADTKLIGTFIGMGVDELSVSPSQVLKVRDAIRRTDLSEK